MHPRWHAECCDGWRIEECTFTGASEETGATMVTIVTNVELKEGVDQEWDAVMGSRMTGAKKQPGWVGGQLLRSEEIR